MKSVYEKDVSKLWIILVVTIVLSIMLVGYSYSYNVDNIKEEDIFLTTVYNTGFNSCIVTDNDIYNDLEGPIKGVECRFTVIGYNNSNDNLNYKIVVKNNQNNNINSKFIKMYLVNDKNSLQIGPFNGNVLDNNFYEEITLIKNSKVFDEYYLKLWISEEELINNSWYNIENGNFLVNIDVIY